MMKVQMYKNLFNKWWWNNFIATCKTTTIKPPQTKCTSFPEDNIGENTHHLGNGGEFLVQH